MNKLHTYKWKELEESKTSSTLDHHGLPCGKWESRCANCLGNLKFCFSSILLYGAEAWTITKNLEKKNDGCYIRLLRHAQNISWKKHV